tara:strand:- start:3756 stop:4367 length:612 start_codon:yes stop_codon:yes gene_type:complete
MNNNLNDISGNIFEEVSNRVADYSVSLDMNTNNISGSNPFNIDFVSHSEELRNLIFDIVESVMQDVMEEGNNNDVNNMSERISEGLNIRFRDRLREYFNIFVDNIGFTLESGNSELNMNSKLTAEEYKENVIIHSRVSKKKALELGFENETDCPICLDTLKFGLTWHQLKCGHMYHPKCLKQYLTKKCIRTECPTCRKDVRLN